MESGRGTKGPGPGLPGKLSHPLARTTSVVSAAMLKARFIPVLFHRVPKVRDPDGQAAVLRACVSRDRTSRPRARQQVQTQPVKPQTTTNSRVHQKTG